MDLSNDEMIAILVKRAPKLPLDKKAELRALLSIGIGSDERLAELDSENEQIRKAVGKLEGRG